MRPTRRALVLAVAGVAFAALPVVLDGRLWLVWVGYWGALLLGLGVDLVLAPRRRRITCAADAPDTMFVGEPAAADLRLTIPATHPIAFEAVVDLGARLRPVDPVRGTGGRDGVTITLPLDARRRGRASIERLWLRYAGPMRLAEVTARIAIDHAVSIVPNVMPVRRAALRFTSQRTMQSGLKIERYKGDGTEFDSLREFVRGDDTRAIHWRSSARHRAILCRQHRAERNHQLVVAIDSGRLMSEWLDDGIPKLDHAITAGLLLSYVGLKSGDRVGLYSFDANVGCYVPPRPGLGQYRTLSHVSGTIAYADAETNFTLGLTTLAQRLKRRSLVVVLTDFVDAVTAELMVDNLGRLAARHVVVFVTLRDPVVERLAREEPATVPALNRAVVANSYLHDRHVVVRRLAGLGLHTIDAEAGAVGPELINRYLEIKRRELV